MNQDRWRLVEKLGNGYFGTTFRAEDSEGVIAEPIAMKVIPLTGVRGLHEDSLLKEISQLYALTHANLVAVRAEPRRIEYNGVPHLAIGLELCETTLADELRQCDDRDRLMRVVVADVLQGLVYMHQMGTVHRDLHAGNILRRGRTWKIGDFGQARFVNDDGVVPGGPVGAREIVAPEVARGEAASVAVDVYALGVLVHYSLTDRYLVDARSPKRAAARGAVQIHDSLPREWRPFVSAATQELANRPTAQAIRSLVPRQKSSSKAPSDGGRPARSERSSEPARREPLIDVACSSLVDGHFEVFVLDADGGLWHSWWWHNPGWSPWERMDAPPLTALAAGSHDHRHQEVFAITADGRVLNRWNWLSDDHPPNSRTQSEWCDKWYEFAGPLPNDRVPIDVACSSLVDGHFEVFVLDADGGLWHSWWWHNPGWSPWERMDAPPLTALAAGSHDHRHQEVLGVTSGGALANRWNWLETNQDSVPDASTPSTWTAEWGWLR